MRMTDEMHFFDCNTFYSLSMNASLAHVQSVEDLLAEMDQANVERALICHIAQHDVSPHLGNQRWKRQSNRTHARSVAGL